MASEQQTGEQALDRLRTLALESGQSMRAVAEWVLEERPTEPVPTELGQVTMQEEPDPGQVTGG